MKNVFWTISFTLFLVLMAGICAVIYFTFTDSEKTTKENEILYKIPQTNYPDFENVKHNPELISLLISKIKSHPEDWEFKDGASSCSSSDVTKTTFI